MVHVKVWSNRAACGQDGDAVEVEDFEAATCAECLYHVATDRMESTPVAVETMRSVVSLLMARAVPGPSELD